MDSGKEDLCLLPTLQVSVLVMCHTRELAFQISKEYERFSKYMPSVKVSVFFGGLSIKKDEDVLKKNCPHVVVGTPGRILALVRSRSLNLRNVKHFVLDECDKMLEQLDMRRDVQEIFRLTPHEKQCMMFSATLSKEIRPVCRKFMQDVSRVTPQLAACLPTVANTSAQQLWPSLRAGPLCDKHTALMAWRMLGGFAGLLPSPGLSNWELSGPHLSQRQSLHPAFGRELFTEVGCNRPSGNHQYRGAAPRTVPGT